MTSLFPWSPPELEEVQNLFLSYTNDSFDDCTCGCKGFPISILTVEFEEKELDRQAYLSCPARNRRRYSKEWSDFQDDDVYQQFLIDIYPIRYGPQIEAAGERRRRKEKERERQLKNVAARKRAQDRDESTYFGSKCANGHDGERKVSNNECVSCRQIHHSIRDAIKRGAFREKLSKAEKGAIAEIYKKARRRTAETGVQYHVDHMKPLAAGGRHHPSNLQILTAEENLSKGAKYNNKLHSYSKAEKKQFEKVRSASSQNDAKPSTMTDPKKRKGFWSSFFG